LVKRFDRVYKDDVVTRLHVIDGCQMLNLSPAYKYEQNFGTTRDVEHIREGASFQKLFAMSKKCTVSAVAQLELVHWAMFNLIIGNSDAHGKNLFFFIDKRGIKPTPFYDMLCVMMYDFDHNLAMAYGDEFNPNEVFAYQFREFAEEIGMNYKLVSKVLVRECDKIIKALEENIVEEEVLLEEESFFLAKLSASIVKRANRFREIGLEMAFVSFP